MALKTIGEKYEYGSEKWDYDQALAGAFWLFTNKHNDYEPVSFRVSAADHYGCTEYKGLPIVVVESLPSRHIWIGGKLIEPTETTADVPPAAPVETTPEPSTDESGKVVVWGTARGGKYAHLINPDAKITHNRQSERTILYQNTLCSAKFAANKWNTVSNPANPCPHCLKAAPGWGVTTIPAYIAVEPAAPVVVAPVEITPEPAQVPASMVISLKSNRDKNRAKITADSGESPCYLCGRGVNITNPHYMIHIGGGGTLAVNDAAAAQNLEGEMGWFPIGSECLRQNKALYQFVKTAGVAESLQSVGVAPDVRRAMLEEAADTLMSEGWIDDAIIEDAPAATDETPAEPVEPAIKRPIETAAGLITCRRNQKTGFYVGIYDGKAAEFDTTGGRWYTVCEQHGTNIAHSTKNLAFRHYAAVTDWCEECRDFLANGGGKSAPAAKTLAAAVPKRVTETVIPVVPTADPVLCPECGINPAGDNGYPCAACWFKLSGGDQDDAPAADLEDDPRVVADALAEQQFIDRADNRRLPVANDEDLAAQLAADLTDDSIPMDDAPGAVEPDEVYIRRPRTENRYAAMASGIDAISAHPDVAGVTVFTAAGTIRIELKRSFRLRGEERAEWLENNGFRLETDTPERITARHISG
jgi:hypothetical protein